VLRQEYRQWRIYNEDSGRFNVASGLLADGVDGAAGRKGEDRIGVGRDGADGNPASRRTGRRVQRQEAMFLGCIFTGTRVGRDRGTAGMGERAARSGVGGDGAEARKATGAIASTGRLVITNSYFTGNVALGGDGGSGGSDETVLGSGHGGAGAPAGGGAIHSTGWLLIARSSFATNSAWGGSAAAAGAPSFNVGRDGARGGRAVGAR
jgi:hypothetical protein